MNPFPDSADYRANAVELLQMGQRKVDGKASLHLSWLLGDSNAKFFSVGTMTGIRRSCSRMLTSRRLLELLVETPLPPPLRRPNPKRARFAWPNARRRYVSLIFSSSLAYSVSCTVSLGYGGPRMWPPFLRCVLVAILDDENYGSGNGSGKLLSHFIR